MNLEAQITGINNVLAKALNMIAPFIKEKEIIVENNCIKELYIKCDRIHIQEVLHNIFKNSIEAMGIKGKLSIGITESKKNYAITITDTGCGIPKENLPNIFDPFFSTKRTGMNFGLGLSYCYNVMLQHGGSLEIDSEKDTGTTVSLFFQKEKLSGWLIVFLKGALPMDRIEVMIVEDDPDWIKILSSYIAFEDDILIKSAAATKDEAVKMALTTELDVILMDINLSENKRDGILAALEILEFMNTLLKK